MLTLEELTTTFKDMQVDTTISVPYMGIDFRVTREHVLEDIWRIRGTLLKFNSPYSIARHFYEGELYADIRHKQEDCNE